MPIAVPVAVRKRDAFAWLSARPIPKSEILTLPSGGHHHVLGLHVAVDDPAARRVLEPGEEPLEHPADLGEGHLPDQRPERPALDVLHRDVGRPLVLEVVVHRDDVRMAERAGHARLAQEPLGEGLVGRVERGELLQRNEPVEVGLTGEIHGRHAAPTDLLQQLVAADPLEDQCHSSNELNGIRGCPPPQIGQGSPNHILTRRSLQPVGP